MTRPIYQERPHGTNHHINYDVQQEQMNTTYTDCGQQSNVPYQAQNGANDVHHYPSAPMNNTYHEYGQLNSRPYDDQSAANNSSHYQATLMEPTKKTLQRQEGFLQLKSHGGSCAMQIETTQTKDEWFTATIESARKDPTDPKNMKFEWKSKTTVQLTRNELPVFIAVMLGMLPSIKFSNHGDNNKFLEIENQGKVFYFKTGGSGLKLHSTPVPIQEGYMFATLALNQFVRNFDNLTHEAAINIIGRMANQMFTNGAFTPASPAFKR